MPALDTFFSEHAMSAPSESLNGKSSTAEQLRTNLDPCHIQKLGCHGIRVDENTPPFTARKSFFSFSFDGMRSKCKSSPRLIVKPQLNATHVLVIVLHFLSAHTAPPDALPCPIVAYARLVFHGPGCTHCTLLLRETIRLTIYVFVSTD